MKRIDVSQALLATTATTVGIALVTLVALTTSTGQLFASNQIARQEGLVCTVCHDKPGSKLLTDQGKYYELMRSLDGYREVHSAFGSCTGCHVRKPGSKELTRTGRQFAAVVHDMEGLRIFLQQNHPAVDRKWVHREPPPSPPPAEKPPR
jgi:cytochrome c553